MKTVTTYFALFALLLFVAACGGGGGGSTTTTDGDTGGDTTTDTGGDGSTVAASPVTGAIDNEPWNTTWQVVAVDGETVTDEMRITISSSAIARSNAIYKPGRYWSLSYQGCQIDYSGVTTSSDNLPTDDASVSTIWFVYAGMPTATGCACGSYQSIAWYSTFPSTGGMLLNIRDGFTNDCGGGVYQTRLSSGKLLLLYQLRR